MNKIDDKDVTGYIKYLVEFSNAFVIDDELTITLNSKPFLIKEKEIKIFSVDLKSGEYHMLNPFKETAKLGPEQKWFYDLMMSNIENYTVFIMRSIMEDIVNNGDDVETDKMELTSKYVKDVNKTTLAQFNKIVNTKGNVIASYFDNSSKTTQFQTKLFDEEFHKEFGKTVSNKTWQVVQKLFCDVVGVDDFHKEYQAKASVIGLSRFDSFIKVYTKLIKAMQYAIKIWINTDVDVKLFEEIVENVKIAQKLSAYLVIPTPVVKKSTNIPIWNTNTSLPTVGISLAAQAQTTSKPTTETGTDVKFKPPGIRRSSI